MINYEYIDQRNNIKYTQIKFLVLETFISRNLSIISLLFFSSRYPINFITMKQREGTERTGGGKRQESEREWSIETPGLIVRV